jgi:hypothetical protein
MGGLLIEGADTAAAERRIAEGFFIVDASFEATNRSCGSPKIVPADACRHEILSEQVLCTLGPN